MTSRRQVILSSGTLAAALALGASRARAQAPTELNFGIIATESQASSRPRWVPFLADMERVVGMKINAFFAPDYAGVIEAMRFNRVQVAWFGNASAIQAVDRANGEVFVQSTYSTGREGNGYYSLLIVHRDSPIHSLDDILNSPGRYTFGNGDPNSTSGFLIPSYYVWAQHNIDVRRHFTRIVTGNHESNLLAVANHQVDVATNNTEDLAKFGRNQPEKVKEVREVWRSPLIPGDPLVYRKDLPDDVKAKIKTFFLSYGTPAAGAGWEEQKQHLLKLSYGGVQPSDNRQLLPIRQIMFFRDKIKIQDDANLSVEDKQKRIAEIDAKLSEIDKQTAAK
jgi:phosphonate transport system substrate-binding protein